MAPDGRITLTEAAKRIGLSYSGLYRYVRGGLAHTQDDNGVITLAESTVDKLGAQIKSRHRARNESTKPRAICVRVAPDVYKRFERAIEALHENENPPTVAEWLAELGLRAAVRAGV